MKRFINWVVTRLSAVLSRFGIRAGQVPLGEKICKGEVHDAPQLLTDGEGCNSCRGEQTPAEVNGAEPEQTHETGIEQDGHSPRSQRGGNSAWDNDESAFAETLDPLEAGTLENTLRTFVSELPSTTDDRASGGEPIEVAADEEQEFSAEAGAPEAERKPADPGKESLPGEPPHPEAGRSSPAPVVELEEIHSEEPTNTCETSPAPSEAAAKPVRAGDADEAKTWPEQNSTAAPEPMVAPEPAGDGSVVTCGKAGGPIAAPDAGLAEQAGDAGEQLEVETEEEIGQRVRQQDSPQADAVQCVARAGASSSVDGGELGELDVDRSEASEGFDGQTNAESNAPNRGETVEDQVPDNSLPEQEYSRSTKRRRSPPTPVPAVDAGEYTRPAPYVSALDPEYGRWNSAIVELVLLAKPAGDNVYLCVNPRILAWAFAEAGFDVLSPEEAGLRFTATVGRAYRLHVLEHDDRLHILRRCGADGSPECAALLAASVLAAYHMQSDEELSGNAYYRRLADVLGVRMSGTQPEGFSPRVFESLWSFLRNWLNQAHGRVLAAPACDVGRRRFVELPLAHVPLRSLDIDKLPEFFAWAGYEPGRRIGCERLSADLRLWQQAKNVLTLTGAKAILDDRSEAVLAQVSAELESWDGSFSESATRRSALVEIHFDIVQRRPILAYLPRRPSGFPSVFDDGEHVFEASDEGWYDPSPIHPSDGESLELGFEWRSTDGGMQFALRRPKTTVIPLTPSSDYSGFLSSRRLLRGVKCSVLCRTDLAETVEEYLSEAAQQRLRAVRAPGLPEGWAIVPAFTPQTHIEAPPELDALQVDSNVDLMVSGGLRIGRRWSWVAGAPPRVLVTGVGAGETVRVNGGAAAISDAGELNTNGLLAEPGEYLIEVGRSRRRIEIVNPRVAVIGPYNPACTGTVRVALPSGAWMLIGAQPGQICGTRSEVGRGALASCSFRPVWAVQVGAGPGAEVLLLGKAEEPAKFDPQGVTRSARQDCQRWAGVIYDAYVRRAHFVWANQIGPVEGLNLVWKQYAAAAKRIKRALKEK